jgi:hypothetical protein
MNNSVPDKFLHILTSPTIDAGWTGIGEFWNDANRLGKSVQKHFRKNGKWKKCL